jgi:hypothetical protein
MSDFINRLQKLEMSEDSFVTLSYTEGNDVWHINDGYVTDSVHETATASLLAGLLASGIPVYSNWGEPSEGNDILNEMRANNELDEYERGEEYFQDFITERLAETIYEGEYSLQYSTEQYDYKRGRCDISTEVQVRFGDILKAELDTDGRFMYFDVDSFVSGFNVSVQTPNGTLTFD